MTAVALAALGALTVLALAWFARDAHVRHLASRAATSASDERFAKLRAQVDAVGMGVDHARVQFENETSAVRDEVDALKRQVAPLLARQKR